MQVVKQIFHKNSETHIRDTVSIMNVLSLQFSLSNDFLSFEFKLMSKVTNFREDIIRNINPYLQNCESRETETGDSTIDLEYLQAGAGDVRLGLHSGVASSTQAR